jgi:hypothetical protein
MYDLNWDENQHLHPDERFLTMVGNNITIPENIQNYLDPNSSTLNPRNNNYDFFVYGLFPITINKVIAQALNNDTYDLFTIQGRFLSGFADALVIIIIFGIVKQLEKKYKIAHEVKYLASLIYALLVLPIQLSHFFAVDTFLNFFVCMSLYLIIKFAVSYQKRYLLLSSIFFGFAIATKISAIYFLPLNFLILFSIQRQNLISTLPNIFKKKSTIQINKDFIHTALFYLTVCIFYGLVTYITVRLSDPYLFESSNFLLPQISSSFINDVKALKSWEGDDVWFPPAVQWISKTPIIFSLQNIAFFGVGIIGFIFFIYGVIHTVLKKRIFVLIVILLWMGIYVIYQGTQFVQTMRYYLILYPFIALFSGIGVQHFVKKLYSFRFAICIVLFVIYPVSFLSIYIQKHTRVEASEWIYTNIPHGSVIAGEHWDDVLPVSFPELSNSLYTYEQLPVFDQDTEEKWDILYTQMNNADYLVLSSNRGWGSISTLPQRYPRMTRFYTQLFSGETEFQLIKSFSSYPSLKYLGVPVDFPDYWADEGFTVFDHPQVFIFKKITR